MFSALAQLFLKTQAPPSFDAKLEEADRHLNNFSNLISPAPESRPRTPFDSGLPASEISMANLSLKQKMRVLPQALPLFWNMWRSGRMYDGQSEFQKNEASEDFIAELRRVAQAGGAKDLRFVQVPRNAIFKGKGLPQPYAILFSVEMEKDKIETAPSFECQLEVMRGYKRMAILSNRLARLLRENGFAAYPGTALGGLTDYTHLAELAGLGAIGYHGLLISPDEGARLRINTIYTNIQNLPIEQENPHLWVREFCDMCKKCVRSCPADAIYSQPQARGDSGMQCIDHDRCRDYFARHFGCAVCLSVCPFSQKGYDVIQKRFKGNVDAPLFRISPEYDLPMSA